MVSRKPGRRFPRADSGVIPQAQPHSLIETRIPLWWILGTAASILLSMGGLFVKLNSIGEQVVRLERKIDSQDSRFSILNDLVGDIRGVNQVQQSQIDRATRDLSEISRYYRTQQP